MRFSLMTGVGVLAAASLLAPSVATAQGSRSQSGQQQLFNSQQNTTTSRQAQGEGVPLYVSPGEIRMVQRRLARLGFNPGPIDGRWRPQTQQALARFQQQAGLNPTGNINLATYHTLRTLRRPGGQFLGMGERQSGIGMQQGSQQQ